jgi:stage V sporulation protein B
VSAKSDAGRAGRGGVAVLGAKVFFVVSGLAQQVLLQWAVGLAGYGAWARVQAVASIVNNVVVAGSVQGVSRVVARSLGHERAAFRSLFRVHVALAVALAILFAALSPLVAAFQGAPHIAAPLAVMAIVVLLYGTYAPVIGLLNGRAEFTRQAALDVSFATLRTGLMVGIGWMFVHRGLAGVTGAALGFAAAATCIVPLAMWLAFPLRGSASEDRPAPAAGEYLGELWPLAIAQLCTNAVMQVDISLLGHFLSANGGGDVTTADEWVGVYRACQLFAFLPYQLLLSITQVLFPMLARARAEGDPARVRLYVERGARLAALASGMMVAVLVGVPGAVLRFAYTAEIAERGAHTLRVLALGQGAFTMLAIATTVLASLGRERRAFLVTLGALGGVLSACALLTPRAAFGEMQLLSTAVATSVGLGLALAVGATEVRREVGGFIPALTAVRALLALSVAGAAGTLFPATGRLVTPLVAVAIAAVYLLVLVVSRELTRDDLHALSSLRGG